MNNRIFCHLFKDQYVAQFGVDGWEQLKKDKGYFSLEFSAFLDSSQRSGVITMKQYNNYYWIYKKL